MPEVTVVLCVRNGAATLARQLAALGAQDAHLDWELVLVDNGSTDASVEIAERFRSHVPALRVVTEPEAGTNRARNRGVREARGELVLCCDADDEVAPAWLAAMARGLREFDVVGGALEAEKLNRAHAPVAGVIQRDELPSVFGWSSVVGASLGFRRRVFDEVGGFDTGFPLGSDEVDFVLRAQYAGATVGFVPDAVVHYRVKDTALGLMRQRFSYGRGHQVLVDKHARAGFIESRTFQRWKVVGVSAANLARRAPELAHSGTRLQYVASSAYLAGRVAELLRELVAATRRAPG